MAIKIKTTPELNAKLVGSLRYLGSSVPALVGIVPLYAAQRIEELEAENERLRDRLRRWLPGWTVRRKTWAAGHEGGRNR